MNLDVAVFLWGALVTLIVVAGIVTGEWKEKLYYARADTRTKLSSKDCVRLMTLDVVVFLFGVLVSTLVGAGLLVLFYGYAYAEQAKRENIQLSDRMQRVVRFILGEDAA